MKLLFDQNLSFKLIERWPSFSGLPIRCGVLASVGLLKQVYDHQRNFRSTLRPGMASAMLSVALGRHLAGSWKKSANWRAPCTRPIRRTRKRNLPMFSLGYAPSPTSTASIHSKPFGTNISKTAAPKVTSNAGIPARQVPPLSRGWVHCANHVARNLFPHSSCSGSHRKTLAPSPSRPSFSPDPAKVEQTDNCGGEP